MKAPELSGPVAVSDWGQLNILRTLAIVTQAKRNIETNYEFK